MDMIADEDIDIGEDLTPQLLPISCALHDSYLNTHCSSCFSPLPIPDPDPNCDLLYCSPLCSSSTSIHFSSAQLHLLRLHPIFPTSDLRAALGLLHSYRDDHARISGLLTNLDKLVKITDNDDEMLGRIRDGSKAMAAARRLRDGKQLVHKNENENEKEKENGEVSLLFEEEAVALCAVITNGVEVQDNEGRNIGVTVYDFNFSWINHSCSPNACYRFLFSPSFPVVNDTSCCRLPSRLVPHASSINVEFRGGYSNYGPRIIVRSIKRINKHEEVTVAYTDLLQPKAIRQLELWSKYRFSCCCVRCDASPPSYVDRVLQEISAANLTISSSDPDLNLYRDEATQKLIDHVDGVITDYLNSSDSQSCFEKLENILIFGFLDEVSETEGGKLNIKLHPLHHVALNAYMTLASAYKMHASDLVALNYQSDGHHLEVFHMFRMSAGYSYLLAAATYHLFCFEFSLITSVANFWTSSGESLLTVARRSSAFGHLGLQDKNNCTKCSCMDKFKTNGLNENFDNISSKFIRCITSLSQEVWSSLSRGSHYLQKFKDPMDFRHWRICSPATLPSNMGAEIRTKVTTSELEAMFSHRGRINLFQLGVHCLLYGEFLAGICYNKHFSGTKHIPSLLYDEDKLN